jgi:Domain of unknown function (DUF1990)
MKSDHVLQPADELQSPATGSGPLLQRDYWAVIRECRCRPSEVMQMVASRFCELPPADVVAFSRPAADGQKPVEVGECIDIRIKLAGDARVRVIHTTPCSVTLGTLVGHPEAGRITFGSYRNDAGAVIFHIRSRARSSSIWTYCGFIVGGDPMQTESWTVFVNNVAAACGNGVDGEGHAETRAVPKDEWEPADESMDGPTFVALAD